jgi:hypothetical protein
MATENYNVPIPEDRMTVVCLYCDKPQEVSRKALQLSCKFCHKILKLEDVRIKEYHSRRQIDTLGIVTVEKKGNVIVTDRINCGGLIVRGKVKGDVKSRGPVLIGPEAELQGDVQAPTLAVGAGAILQGHYEIGPKPPPET